MQTVMSGSFFSTQARMSGSFFLLWQALIFGNNSYAGSDVGSSPLAGSDIW